MIAGETHRLDDFCLDSTNCLDDDLGWENVTNDISEGLGWKIKVANSGDGGRRGEKNPNFGGRNVTFQNCKILNIDKVVSF